MSKYIYEISGWSGCAASSIQWLENQFLPILLADADIDVDLYLPVDSRYGEAPPDFIVTIGFSSQEDATRLLANSAVNDVLAPAGRDLKVTGQFMQIHSFPIAGTTPRVITERFSFVVRYFLPADDVAGFQQYYMRMHPPILAEFEGIRNILCYIPLELADVVAIPSAGYLIGNEVVFDSLADFERALASPVAEKSKADARTFPPYSGRNPHFAMERTRLRAAGS